MQPNSPLLPGQRKSYHNQLKGSFDLVAESHDEGNDENDEFLLLEAQVSNNDPHGEDEEHHE